MLSCRCVRWSHRSVTASTHQTRRGDERARARPGLACTGWLTLDTITHLTYNWTFPLSHGHTPSSIPMESCDPADRSWQSHLPSGQGQSVRPHLHSPHFPTREIIMTEHSYIQQTGYIPPLLSADLLQLSIRKLQLTNLNQTEIQRPVIWKY